MLSVNTSLNVDENRQQINTNDTGKKKSDG